MNSRAFLRVISRALFVATAACAALQTIGHSIEASAAQTVASNRKPNVLFIAVDDLNDWVACMEGYQRVSTLNIDRLAKRGILFTNAHCASPLCNPSRSALMTGLRPSTTGIYGNAQPWRPALPNTVTIPEHFMAHGYRVEGCGKIFHHDDQSNPPSTWHDYFDLIPDNAPDEEFPLNRILPRGKSLKSFDWGVLDKAEAEYGDAKAVDWGIRFLEDRHDKPFFLAVGIFHPHLPWYAPERYFELYPEESIRLPVVPNDDLDDIPAIGLEIAANRRADFDKIKTHGKWEEAVQAYLSSISFADAQLGRLLDALDSSPYSDNTVIVLWSDHGWHLGEKQHWHKSTLWERATRVPFVVVAPGVTTAGTKCSRPVSLIDIYPTLIELCGLTTKGELDGTSLAPLLKEPSATWNRPAVITRGRGNHAVRTDRWRYIRYRDGGEELYDHKNDTNEWTNLAQRPGLEGLKKKLARWLPTDDAAEAPYKSDYIFDSETYKWTPKTE